MCDVSFKLLSTSRFLHFDKMYFCDMQSCNTNMIPAKFGKNFAGVIHRNEKCGSSYKGSCECCASFGYRIVG